MKLVPLGDRVVLKQIVAEEKQSQESYYLDSLKKKNHSRQKLWQLDQAELLMEKK